MNTGKSKKVSTTKKHVPSVGFLRLPQVLALIPVSKGTWWTGVKEGRFPQPVKLGPRITAWRAEDIHQLIEQLSQASYHPYPPTRKLKRKTGK